MGYDIFKRAVVGRSWARDEDSVSTTGSITDRAWEAAVKKMPWKPIVITAAIVLGTFLILPGAKKVARKKDTARTRASFSDDWDSYEPTTQLVQPNESTARLMKRLRQHAA